MEKLFNWIVNHDEISLLCCSSFRTAKLIRQLGIEVDNINYDINFRDMPGIICNYFVFDNIKLRECVLHYNCEKTYPVGKIHKGTFILRGDNKEHNGDCNPIISCEHLAEQNELTTIYDSFQQLSKNKKYMHYFVYGTNI